MLPNPPCLWVTGSRKRYHRPMRVPRFVVAASVTALVVVACADTDNENATLPDAGTASSGGSSGDAGGKKDGAPECTPQTCENVLGACGDHDDGCGKKFSCGECKPQNPCIPLSCATLGKTCGTHDDTCGGTVACGACATDCVKDGKEPNDTMATAVALKDVSDFDNITQTVPTLASADGDEDWFKLKVTDGGFGGNPLITVSVTDAKLEVTVFHVCDSKPDFSYCADTPAGGKQDDQVGKGCRRVGSVALNTDCTGTTETGMTYVRVRKATTDKVCHAYDLSVKVE